MTYTKKSMPLAMTFKKYLFSQPIFLSLLAVVILSQGCSSQKSDQKLAALEAKIQNEIEKAQKLFQSKDPEKALHQLESLNKKHPNNPAILETLGFLYVDQKDSELAAFYLEHAARNDKNRSQLLLYAAQTYQQASNLEAAARNYFDYLQKTREDGAAWKALGHVYQQLNRPKFAIDALIEASQHPGGELTATESAEIGQMFHQLENWTQAQRWFEISLSKNEDPKSKITALLGLLALELDSKNWESAYTFIQEIDSIDPSALDNSPLAYARAEIQKWFTANKQLKKATSNLSNIPTDVLTTVPDIEELKEDFIESIALPTPDDLDAHLDFPKNLDPNQTQSDFLPSQQTLTTKELSKDALQTITLEDSIQIEQDTTKTFSPHSLQPTESPTASNTATPSTIEENPSTRIKHHWQKVVHDPNAPEIWIELSKEYLRNKQFKDAEIAALEAVRLSPDDPTYTLNYLKVLQWANASSAKFMQELLRAHDQFPENPDITLATAKGYHHVSGDSEQAIRYYAEFLKQASQSHPQRQAVQDIVSLGLH
jgi:tetratricopeptide (TPR) repeat protein